jgi:predicted nuclease of predicted toxin-antitoxin system
MKFLLDENLPPSLASQLNNIGYKARHVISIGYNNTPDFKITELAAQTGEIVLTHDTDFGTILALTGSSKPSVNIVSMGNNFNHPPFSISRKVFTGT